MPYLSGTELLPLDESSSKEAMGENIATLRQENYPEKQAVAIAYSVKEKASRKAARKPSLRNMGSRK